MTNALKYSLIVITVLVIGAILCSSVGGWALWNYQEPALAKNEIASRNGKVWNSVRTCSDNLGALEEQAKFWAKYSENLVSNIAAGRSDMKALIDAYKGKGFDGKADAELSKILEKFNSPNNGIMVQMRQVVEAYPAGTDVTKIMIGLMDETSSCFGTIKKSRTDLINAQTDYNKLLIMKPWVRVLGFQEIEILGSDANPAAPAFKSGLNNTPVPPPAK